MSSAVSTIVRGDECVGGRSSQAVGAGEEHQRESANGAARNAQCCRRSSRGCAQGVRRWHSARPNCGCGGSQADSYLSHRRKLTLAITCPPPGDSASVSLVPTCGTLLGKKNLVVALNRQIVRNHEATDSKGVISMIPRQTTNQLGSGKPIATITRGQPSSSEFLARKLGLVLNHNVEEVAA